MSVLPDDVKSWKCEICARKLLSKAGYVNHKKSHEKDLGYANPLPSRPADTTCVTTCAICSKKCKTTAGLKLTAYGHSQKNNSTIQLSEPRQITGIHLSCLSTVQISCWFQESSTRSRTKFEQQQQ